jgi:hypothetical protein
MKNHESTPSPPPDYLSEYSRRELWPKLVGRCRGAARRELLAAALAARDRGEAAREAIDRGGMTTTSPKSGVEHLSPLIRVEGDSRRLFSKIMQQLGLQHENQFNTED